MELTTESKNRKSKQNAPARLVAVIDIGATSIRMVIGQVTGCGEIETIESLSQAVSLGKDTFTKERIDSSTIQKSVRVLKNYCELLEEYGITDLTKVRVVATSAVREAQNQSSFMERIFVATGLRVDAIDEAEVNRLTYLGVQPVLASNPRFSKGQVLIVEVGGGSTDVLLVKHGDVLYSHTYRLGSLRLRKNLESFRAPAAKARDIMTDHIDRVVEQIIDHVSPDDSLELIVLGGDVRFVAHQLHPGWANTGLARISRKELEKFVDDILGLSVDKLVRNHCLTLPDAETLGPALLTYCQLARSLRLKHVFVTDTNMRDGLLKQVAFPDAWSDDFKRQIIRSALELGKRFQLDERHGRHVADLSGILFRALQDEHKLDARYELLLYVAALLHDIGYCVSQQSHHKHSMYLIRHGELFGLSQKDMLLVALVARYHRRGTPKPLHEGYSSLDWEERIKVSKMAAILRIADSLDRSNHQRVGDIECQHEKDQLVINVPTSDDLSLEQMALNQKGKLFEDVFGLHVLLRNQ